VNSSAPYRVILVAVLVWGARAHAAATDNSNDPAQSAVIALGSGNPAQRDKAVKTLLAMGADARRAVVQATHSDDPELRVRASELLLKLPWYLPDDSPEVRRLLDGYGQYDVEKRKEIVDSLSKLAQHGHDALLRLIVEEPSDDVKWAIAGVVRLSFQDNVLAAFRKLDTSTQNAPLLAAAGHAWLPVDVPRGIKLLRQALALDRDRPADDGGEVEAAYDRLQNLALLDGRFADVAQLLRQRAHRGATDEDGDPTQAPLELFAAHAKFGPLPGFDKDLTTFNSQLADPRVMFALGKTYQRCGQNVLADAVFRAAYASDMVSIEDRFNQGDFLIRQGWLELAEAEIDAIFDLAPDHSTDPVFRHNGPVTPDIDNANAHFRLAQIAAARDDDFAAAENMQKALELHGRARGMLRGATEQALFQDIDWHYLRAARAKNDQAGVNKYLDNLTDVPILNPDIANDVVPMLRAAGRNDQADATFKQVYEALQAAWNHRADHPMPRNNLAWLCARCGVRKDEALKMATEATQAMPDNAAFVDTLAEAHYQLGHYEQAAKLEAKVVAARPTDHFLRAQLKKFTDAATKKPQNP
jgi:tetratricopeptide (TPR) repeat protein